MKEGYAAPPGRVLLLPSALKFWQSPSLFFQSIPPHLLPAAMRNDPNIINRLRKWFVNKCETGRGNE
jgi:hypothetical protein